MMEYICLELQHEENSKNKDNYKNISEKCH